MNNRRSFIRKMAVAGSFAGFAGRISANEWKEWSRSVQPGNNKDIKFKKKTAGKNYQPLEKVTVILNKPGNIRVYDSSGQVYFEGKENNNFTFPTGGGLGKHLVLLLDNKGSILNSAAFFVDTSTYIKDQNKLYAGLLNDVYWTMVADANIYPKSIAAVGKSQTFRVNRKFYEVFVTWLRDHVHTLKGMKYYYAPLCSGIDLYAETQRDDGMIFDNVAPRHQQKNWWDKRFRYGGFIREIENGLLEMKRIPVEADVEYLFVEGIYFTWKATGNDPWMQSLLNKAISAINYSLTSPLRWSKKYQLVKRGYTIDTWDFQSDYDMNARGDTDPMVIDAKNTRFGIMFGDNTGLMAACNYLAEMLEYSDRSNEAAKYRKLAQDIKKRLDAISWNGSYYTHHIPEDPSVQRDFGVDTAKQVSLSNAYSLNRGLTHPQCIQIIKTYRQLRNKLPHGSPGEWYTIYPPFYKGFGNDGIHSIWEYMNGGVTPIVAGELAHGAFEHGFEKYGVDILNRIYTLAEKTDGYLYCTYRGSMPEPPVRNFKKISILDAANDSFPPKAATDHGKWLGNNSVYADIPFQIEDPDNQKNTAIRFDEKEKILPPVSVKLGVKAESIYVLHTASQGYIGTITLKYDDHTSFVDYIDDKKAGFWWTEEINGGKSPQFARKAWRTDDDNHYIAFYVYGFNNPYPNKGITEIIFERARVNKEWVIGALTVCDKPVFFMPSFISYGIPDKWGAAAIIYALIEGLAGVKDNDVTFHDVMLSPRWEASGTKEVNVSVRYEASDGYVYYRYTKDEDKLKLSFTGNFNTLTLRVLLPENVHIQKVMLDKTSPVWNITQIESSKYLAIDGIQSGIHQLEICYG